MANALILLSLLATCHGQLIYPDDYKLLRSTTIHPYIFSTDNQARPTSNRNAPLPYPAQPQFSKSHVSLNPTPVGSFSASQHGGPAPGSGPRITVDALQNWSNHVNNIIVNGVLKFALDMEREIHRSRGTSVIGERENIVFSPISLAMTMAIVLAGSAGRTFHEVSKVLGFESGVDISQDSEIVHQMFGILLNQLRHQMIGSPGPRIDLATATYIQDGYPVLQQFKSLSNNVYGNEVINVDFARNGKAAQNVINAWVKEKTRGKILSILDEAPGSDTTAILLSALYFKGEWNQYFIDGATRRRPFFIESDETVDMDMMYNAGTFPFFEDRQLGVKILGIPYKGQEISMYILLPTAKGAKALREFQSRLNANIVENLIKNMKNETCIFGIPRMKLSSSLSLRATLQNLGLHSLFDPATSDLSLMSQANAINSGNYGPQSTPSYPEINTADSVPGKSTIFNKQGNKQDVLIFTRFDGDDEKAGHMVRRNYFTYEDKLRGYAVQQWATGFSIKRTRNRRGAVAREEFQKDQKKNVYNLDDGVEGNEKITKIVTLEGNKYRFQDKQGKERSRRQSRPINEDFLQFVKSRNLPSYGLDELRNSGRLVNPHLYASDVLHKVEIEITEKGTEAAAVTGVVLERDGSQKRLIANRPFIFFIRHDTTGLVLFWGTLNTPTPNYPAT